MNNQPQMPNQGMPQGQGQGQGQQQNMTQQQRIANLSPSHVQGLYQKYHQELNAVCQAGPQTDEGQNHFLRAQQIKHILTQYQTYMRSSGNQNAAAAIAPPNLPQFTPEQRQQLAQAQTLAAQRQNQQRMQQQQTQGGATNQQQQQAQAQTPAQGQAQAQTQAQAQAQTQSQPQPQTQTQAQGQQNQQALRRQQQAQFANMTPAQQHQVRQQQLEQFRKMQIDLQSQLERMEQSLKNPNLTDQERQDLKTQEQTIRTKKDHVTQLELNLKQTIHRNATAQSGGTPNANSPQLNQQQRQGTPGQAPQQQPVSRQGSPPQNTPQQQQQAARFQQQQQQIRQQQQAQAQAQAQARQQQQQQQQQQAAQGRSQSPQSQTQSQSQNSPASNRGSTPSAAPGTNASATGPSARPNPPNTAGAQAMTTNRPQIQSIAINDQINVKSPTAVQTKPQRPTLTGGASTSASALNTPAISKLPPVDMSGDRVLNKRKLRELVTSVVGDEETQIDGDVEELLLDIADEFVTSVTSFSCRLAKHRKSDTLEAKDVQFHLERNWNIRIPGYNADEIRSVRKTQPTQSYSQKVSGVNVAKSVSGKN